MIKQECDTLEEEIAEIHERSASLDEACLLLIYIHVFM